ncbi:MAG: 16S rRNA (adenine(1518)-N(6)/adenine(1519)-N(6))-dimethyltransferase RsmA [Endomicrobium sp.]|jgi:16S rRNA (adenine1518-N6/adenine1519-N6)-dimethyltransferase|nr:16S rRNA (adenine(1518)-N(6)/adenine(1519)-N(6))-dimethyltransferase RsmA [Endomicrobium sp.]
MSQKYGQNFLIDKNVANNIVKAADLKKQDKVLEIGPGKGILTKIIQSQAKHLTAVEIDNNLFRKLSNYITLNNIKNTKIINEDFLRYNVPTAKFKIISNLPYNTATAMIQKFLPLKNWTYAILMLQKEVARRLSAHPETKSYGYISIFTSCYAECKILFDVSPKCFNPQPKVVSSVIKLTNKNQKQPESLFFEFVKHFFSMRRKTILNCLASFKYLKLEKNHALQIINACNLNPFLRPDNLSISDFFHLTNEMKKMYNLSSVKV